MTSLISVVETELYMARATKLMSDAEREHVVDLIAADPTAGVVIKGTNGLRKMRIPLRGKGKRGGGRIVYWFRSEDYPVYLMFVFAKNASQDLSGSERKALIRAIDGLVADLGG